MEDWYRICAGLQSIGRIGSGSEVDCMFYGGLVLCLSWTVEIWRTCTGSVLDCRAYEGLVRGLLWTVEFIADLKWVCAGLQSTGRTGFMAEVNIILYEGLVLNVYWTVENTEDWH